MRYHRSLVPMGLIIIMIALWTASVFSQNDTETVVKENNPAYDNVSWQDINNKREERKDNNFFSNMYYTFFKSHKEPTYTGEEITVVQTAGNVDFDDNNSPVQFVHITSDK